MCFFYHNINLGLPGCNKFFPMPSGSGKISILKVTDICDYGAIELILFILEVKIKKNY